jgi:tetratricopeptide (TPR) repeat protein
LIQERNGENYLGAPAAFLYIINFKIVYRYFGDSYMNNFGLNLSLCGITRLLREDPKMKSFRRKVLAVFLLGGLLSTYPRSSHASTRAWEGTITIPTYGWAEDVNPKFWALEGDIKFSTTVKGSIVYPYTMQDHLFRTKEDVTYKALFLENDYLKITCLPELGGRLHSVFDKIKLKEMFHINSVIKPGMIAMRGAWISGGVEWNFGPHGHTVTILSPVDAVPGKNPDGSAYIVLNNIDKIFRNRWTVRVTLHPGKAYLDEQIRIFNPTDAINPYYFWNCTAFPCRAGTRFIYPMTLGTDHNGTEFFSWPIHEGKDLSWLKNYEIYSSIFSVNCTFDFFGAYDVDADRGIVQVANHKILGGKKAWTWGTWDFGLVSQKNLTDEDGPYIEVQSGPLPTQSDYGMLLPRQTISWQEWWYPVHGLGDGFEYATKDIAIQSIRDNDKLQLRMLATDTFRVAKCTIFEKDQMLLNKNIDLSYRRPVVLDLKPAPKSAIDVTLKTRNGDLLASFSSPLPIPKVSPPDVSKLMTKPDEQLTVEEKYLKGRKYDLATSRKKAREYYEKALAEDAGYPLALRGLAVLDIEAGLYEDAIERLKKALKRDDSDGLSWFFLGVSHLRLRNTKEAINCAYKAAVCSDTASISYDLAGRAYMRLGDFSTAIGAFGKAVQLNPMDTKAKNHLMLALYASGDKKSAYKQAKKRIATDPTDLVPRALLSLKNKTAITNFVTDEAQEILGEYDFEMLEACLVFAELGLVSEAAELLMTKYIANTKGGQNPLPLYYLAYFASLQGNDKGAQAYRSLARWAYKDHVFPSRHEAIEVFKYAISKRSQDTHAHLLLGNLYANFGRVEEAARHWQKASELDPSRSIAYRNLGLYTWAVKEDLTKAEEYYRKAITARPKDQTLYRDLADIMLAANKPKEAIKVLEATPFEKMRRADVIIMLAQAYVDEQMYSNAIDLLESTPYFVNWEGQTITWDLFHKAHLERGRERFEKKDFLGALQDFELALTYPDNIGVGRSNKPQEAQALYWKGQALQELGRLEEARLAWNEGIDGPEGSKKQNQYRELCKKALLAHKWLL